MIPYMEECGKNAGKIYKTLDMLGPLPKTKLLKTTRLDEHHFQAAIGWLARENKVVKNGALYALGATNLTEKIGSDAGKIWNTLQTQQDIDVSSLAKFADIPLKDAYSAVGWLAREDKVDWQWQKTGKKQMKIKLKY